MRGAVGLERPHLHLAEALPPELRLPAERLLGDQRVRPDRACVDLVVDQVRQLQHVDVADGDPLLEGLAAETVVEGRLAAGGQPRLVEPLLDLGLARAVEDRRGEVPRLRLRSELPAVAHLVGRPSQVGLEDLPHVHARRHPERVEHDLHRRPVGQARHVLFRQDAGDDALVAVATRHLVADRELALHGDVHLDQLDDAGRQLVAPPYLLLLLLEELPNHLDLTLGPHFEHLQLVLEGRVVGGYPHPHQLAEMQLANDLLAEHRALLQAPLASELVVQVRRQRLPLQQGEQPLPDLVVQDANLVLQVLLHHLQLFGLDRLRAVVLLDSLAREDPDADHDAFDAGRAEQRRVAHVARLLAEDGAQQLLLGRELRLALGRDLADEDVRRLDVRADADDPALVEILEEPLGHVRYVAGDLLGAELGVARLDLELLDVDRGVVVLLHQALRDENRVLEVVAPPGHERDEHVAAQGELAELGARPVRQHLPLLHPLPDPHDRLLVDAGVLVGPPELRQVVDVGAHLARRLGRRRLPLDAYDDPLRVDEVDHAAAARGHHRPRVARRDVLHAGPDVRRPRPQQRHGLALHVRSHQRAVGVVVLQERDQRCRHRHQLLRGDVDEIDLVALREHEVARLARVDPLVDESALVVEPGVRLGDDVLVLLPRRQVEGVRFVLRRPLLAPLRGGALLVGLHRLDDLADLVLRAPGVRDLDEVDGAARLDGAVRRLDESELVDARVARQRRDQADVRTLRRLDGTDPPVVGRVHVPDLEPRPLARQPARPEGRQPPLVGNLRQRVGLVHELRQLGRSEELPYRGHHRLRVDEVVRHGGGHLLVDGHLLLDGPLHPHQTDPELVLEQFADRPHAPVAEVVDVVDVRRVPAQRQQIPDHLVEIVRLQDPFVERRIEAELRVQLQAPHPREVVLLRVEEQALEERARAVQGRRIAGAQPPIDLDQRLLLRLDRVLLQGGRQHRTNLVQLGEEHLDGPDLLLLRHRHDARRDLLVGLEDHLAGLGVHDVGHRKGAGELLGGPVRWRRCRPA